MSKVNVRYARMEITKNKMQIVPCDVPQWEAHVLQALWGEDAVVKSTFQHERELPEPADEFERLAQRYGPRDEEIPMVAKVYGSFGPGVNALARELQAAIVEGDEDSGVIGAAIAEADAVAAAEEQAAEEAVEALTQVGGVGEPAEVAEDVVVEVEAADLLPPGMTLEDLVEEGDNAGAEQ